MAVLDAQAAPAPPASSWPPLAISQWQDTRDTLHLWTQVVGKVRLALSPPVNHWWHVPLYVTARGLTTSPMPYGRRAFQMDFDFLDHALRIATCDGDVRQVALAPRSVADFHAEVMARLKEMGLDVEIWTTPVELPDPVPFEDDHAHAAYDAGAAHRFWRALLDAERVMAAFRSGFVGKCSPVHFFWGSFDLAVTRFSGRLAPPHPGAPNVADVVTREAYSHEVSSAGFWPGSGETDAIFYSYAYPEPPGFKETPVRPEAAFYSKDWGEFLLPYDAVRRAEHPEAALLDFFQSTYEAAAERAGWDRAALERAGAGG
ncbi:MAG TPA: DUF5996 family protein [Longimicrobium sp.]|nr:DUF5996 family protein [Longimicrobium sp.]